MRQEPFLFQLNEKPPFYKNLIYGFQWVMIAIPNVIVFSTLCGTALGLDHVSQVSFAQRLLLFTPHVLGVIMMMVTLSLLPFIYPLLIGIDKTHPYGQLVIAGSSLTLVRESSLIALPSPLGGGWPSFSFAPAIVMFCTYLAVMTNAVGSIQGIAEVVGRKGLEERVHRGVGMTGVGGIAAAFLGVIGLVSYSISPGVVLLTRVASRYALTMSGVLLICCAFIPKFWAILTVIPPSVVASALFVVLASQLMAGINALFTKKARLDRREYFTVGLPLLIGTVISISPRAFFDFFPSAVANLVSNGLVVGIVLALLFEHVVFRTRT